MLSKKIIQTVCYYTYIHIYIYINCCYSQTHKNYNKYLNKGSICKKSLSCLFTIVTIETKALKDCHCLLAVE